jgi:glucose-6-phosphate 1-dehydrogenase
VAGGYDSQADFETLDSVITELESGNANGNRLFYLALPPSVFMPVTAHLKETAMSKTGWTRVIVEKPFGKVSSLLVSCGDIIFKILERCFCYCGFNPPPKKKPLAANSGSLMSVT